MILDLHIDGRFWEVAGHISRVICMNVMMHFYGGEISFSLYELCVHNSQTFSALQVYVAHPQPAQSEMLLWVILWSEMQGERQ